MVWKVIVTVLRQLKAERTAAAGAEGALEPDDPAAAFPAFARDFFGGEDTVILSLPSAVPETESQALQAVLGCNRAVSQSLSELEKMEIDTSLPPPALGLPIGCPAISPVTAALGGQIYPPLPPSLPD